MKLNIEIPKLQSYRLYIATPAYGGQCTTHYTKSLCTLVQLLTRYEIPFHINLLSNESLIPRARNTCVDSFMESSATHLMFIDADIGFNALDVVTMLWLSVTNQYDVLAAPYPMKGINWQRVLQAAKSGAFDEKPELLSTVVGNYAFNAIKPTGEGPIQININEVTEVSYTGTGFMLIRRETFERYRQAFPNITYRSDILKLHAQEPSHKPTVMYFQSEIEPESQRYLSEDYMFCHNVRRMGGHVYICPWMQLTHVGTYPFESRMSSIAKVTGNPH